MVKKVNIGDRQFKSPKAKKEYQEKLVQLMEASGWNKEMHYMGEMFLAEIKLSTDDANKHLRDRAKLLGLMQ